ncbi:DUF1566 domain-containing protein [Photobacterium kasasachensis]|uniref:Lcl domain-containing protein n=1 Tax=Photobacterium kasasachensis TaxID=2910240 RepID=UPI003D0CA74B
MKYNKLSALLTAALLTGCNSSSTSSAANPVSQGQNQATQDQKVELSSKSIQFVDASKVTFDAPGVSVQTAQKVTNITTNFGKAYVDQTSGRFVFQPTASASAAQTKATVSKNTVAKAADTTSTHRLASANNYHFEIKYQIDNTNYQVTGYVLPLHKNSDNTVVTRFVKLDAEGTTLAEDKQVMTMETSDWSCVQDASSNLTWQVLQANGEFAFDSTYYWGDRVVNNRDFSESACGLNTVCNTDNLIAAANSQQLCGKSDWRLPTRNEWKTILTNDMLDDNKRLSPVDSFFFPYVDANYDEAYWSSSYTLYPNGHDSNAVEGDWQGSNAAVGDAYVMWMGSDFADERMPPRSTNEPRLSMLVSGSVIADDAVNTIEGITAPLKAEVNAKGDEDSKWKGRFTKLGVSGQPLQDQDAAEWACSQDKFFATEVPNTQILWQRIDKAGPLMSYDQAVAYVDTINANTLCGRNDWRLPTESELKSILVTSSVSYGDYEFETDRAGYVNTIFADTVVEENSYYWTKTADNYYPDSKHMAVAFQSEWSDSSGESNASLYRVRLISTSAVQP